MLKPGQRDMIAVVEPRPVHTASKRSVAVPFPLLFLSLLSFGLRVYRLDQQSLWYDEGFSVYVAGQDLGQIASLVAGDYSPPLHYYLLHFWMGASGESEFAVRFLSVILGALGVPLTYVLARRLTGDRIALWAALWVAVSPFLVWYSQEARAYSLLAVLVLYTSYLLTRLLHNPAQPRLWSLYVLGSILALYSHLYAFLALAIQVAYFFGTMLLQRRVRPILGGGLALSIILVCYLPWAGNTLRATQDTSGYFPGVLRPDYVLRVTSLAFSSGDLLPEEQSGSITMLYAGLALAGAGLLVLRELGRPSGNGNGLSDHSPGGRLFVVAQVVLPVAWVILALYQRPKFFPRHLLASAPFFFMLVGAALDALWKARGASPEGMQIGARFLAVVLAGALLVTSWWGLSNNYFDARYERDDFRSAVAYLQERVAPQEEILLSSGHFFPAFVYYYPGKNWHPVPDDFLLHADHVIGFEVNPELDRILAGKAGVWLVQWQDHIVDPMGTLRLLLEAHGELIDARWQPRGPVLYRYGLPPHVRIAHEPPIAQPLQINFGNQLRLLGYSTPKYREVGVVEPILFWEGLRPLSEDYKVSLRLVDEAGHQYAIADGWPATVGYPTPRWPPGRVVFGRHRISPLPGTPPGEYWVDVVVYEHETLVPLEVLDEQGAPVGTSARIGPFNLIPTEQITTLEDISGEIQNSRQVAFGDKLELVGYNWEPRPVSPGETIEFTLFWRALSDMDQDYRVLFALVNAQGEWSPQPYGGPLGEPGYPTSAWRAGEVLRVQYSYRVPEDAPPGSSQLRILVVSLEESGLRPLEESRLGATAVLFPMEVQVVGRLSYPAIPFSIKVEGVGISRTLIGYSLQPVSPSPGLGIRLTLIWQVHTGGMESLGLRMRLMDEQGNTRFEQRYREPHEVSSLFGRAIGRRLIGLYRFGFPPDRVGSGVYRLALSLYEPTRGETLRVLNPDFQGQPVDEFILPSTLNIAG